MKNFLFKDRDGQTPLPEDLQKGLIPKHIQTIGELNEYEEDNIFDGLVWLSKYSGNHLDHVFWIKLHKRLFDQVWKWAGEIRAHELNNPDFNAPHQIRPNLKELEQDIQFWIQNESYPEREIAARFHEKIETIHPFANGNGRFGRIITEYICERETFEIPKWGDCLKNEPEARRKTYIQGLTSARRDHDYKSLIEVIFS